MPGAVTLDLLIATPTATSIDVVAGDPASCEVRGVTEDSRRVEAGDLFVARPGRATDGARFVAAAVESGAVAVLGTRAVVQELPNGVVGLAADEPADAGARLAYRFHDHPERRLELVGVTGTNGKTTIAALARQIAATVLGPTGSIGTVEIHDGRTSRPAQLTTPGRIELAGALAAMVEAEAERAILEVSSQGLDQGRVRDVDFKVGVFTNLSGDHLDYHGSMEAYERAKAALFESLSSTAFAISNLDDPAGVRMLERTDARRIGVTADPDRSFDGLDGGIVVARHETDDRGMRLELAGRGAMAGGLDVRVPLVGAHNAFNVAAAVAIVRCLGGGLEAIGSSLVVLEPPAGRLEPVHGPEDDIAVFVDYAHTDDALRHVLDATRSIVRDDRSLWIVFGAGGDRDRSKRPRMMRAAIEGADHVIVTSDNPRTESPAAIVQDVLAGATEAESTRIETRIDRTEAIQHAVRTAPVGTVLVVAGKGHETYQIVGTERRFFDDRGVAADALERRRGVGA